MSTLEELSQQIIERMSAIEGKVSEAISPQKIEEMVKQHLDGLLADPAFVRKMKFAGGDDRLAGSKFARWNLSVEDIEYLYDLQTSLKGQRKVDAGFYPGPSPELERAFNELSKARYLTEEEIRQIDRQALDNLWPRVPRSVRGTMGREEWVEHQLRAMDTGEPGYGQQLVGAQYVGELWAAARPDSRVFALLNSFEMTAPTTYLPVEVDIPEMLFVSEATANNTPNMATVKTGSNRVQVNAKKFAIHQMWSGEMEEDSIIPFVPFLRMQAAKALAHYSDSVVINGDETNAATGNINLVDADPPDTKHYLATDGIRHVALVDNTGNGLDVAGTVSLETFRQLRSRMIDAANLVDWGHPTDPNDLVFVADPQTADRIALLDEVIAANLTRPNPNVLAGEVARVIGHPVVSSIAVPLTNAAGMVSNVAANNTKGQIVAFNRRGFVVGWRRRVKLESERLPATDQTRIVYTLRMGLGRFTPTGAASAIEAAAVAFNITV
jgi:HK97 family phage major capsid protein